MLRSRKLRAAGEERIAWAIRLSKFQFDGSDSSLAFEQAAATRRFSFMALFSPCCDECGNA